MPSTSDSCPFIFYWDKLLACVPRGNRYDLLYMALTLVDTNLGVDELAVLQPVMDSLAGGHQPLHDDESEDAPGPAAHDPQNAADYAAQPAP